MIKMRIEHGRQFMIKQKGSKKGKDLKLSDNYRCSVLSINFPLTYHQDLTDEHSKHIGDPHIG